MTEDCPSEDELVQLIEGALDADSIARIEAHIDTCEDCAAVVGGAAGASVPVKPRQVGRYLLDRRIGGGGMGEVWAAWDPKLRREIAVKLVRPDKVDEEKERARLLREARALAKLTHPNVVTVYDVGEAGAEVFIATELVAGDTLASRGGASADWRMVVRLYSQAARGLAAAHAVGLVHRDVKPANLLLGADGRVRVADFGLAIRSDPTDTSSASITNPGAIAGTPAYMAPEQRTGVPVGPPADQYALCVALAEAVAGRRPPFIIDAPTLAAFVAERRSPEPDLEELCKVLARGLAVEPPARHADMTELADALDAIVPPVIAPARLAPAATVADPRAGSGPRARSASRDDRSPRSDRSSSGLRARSQDSKPRSTVAALASDGVPVDDAGVSGGRTLRLRTDGLRNAVYVVGAFALGAAGFTLWYMSRERSTAQATTTPADGSSSTENGPPSPTENGPPSPTTENGPPSPTENGPPSPSTENGPPSTDDRQPSPPNDDRAPSSNDRNAPSQRRPTASQLPPSTTTTAPPTGSTNPPSTTSPPTTSPSTTSPSTTSPSTTSPSTTPPSTTPTGGVTTADVSAAIKRRDGKACRAALDALTSPPPGDFRVESLRAVCEMVAGNCAGGTDLQRALYRREGTPETSAEIIADLYCPFTNDPATRIRRISRQMGPYIMGDCNYFLGPSRAVARDAKTDDDRHVAGVFLAKIAKCVSDKGDCPNAKKILAEAQVFIPALQLNELNAQCR